MKNILQQKTLFVIILFLLNSAFAFSGVTPPAEKINYQAIARNAAGAPLISQAIQVRFTIHDGTAGGPASYQETQYLNTNQFGLFTALIGDGTVITGPFSGISWAGSSKFLQVEMDPAGGSSFSDMGTTQLVTVPFAFVSNQSIFSLDNAWTHFNTDIYNNNTGKVGIGTSIPADKVSIEDATTASNYGILHVKNTATGANDAYGVFGESTPSDYYGTGGFFVGGYRGVKGVVNATGSNQYYGVVGEVTGGTGVNTGTLGTSDVQGVFGSASGTGKGLTTYYGPSFLETAGVNGDATNITSSNGIGYGVVGQSSNPTGHINVGVYGYAANASAGNLPKNYGVFGLTEGDSSLAVLGLCYGNLRSRGLEGDAFNGTNEQMGIFTYISNTVPASNYAGYFYGPIYATNANASIKAFKIDHPQDPENKFLYHSSVESPDMMNIYNGNIVTDANGDAKINLPTYFESLNKDFRYQLTCIGTFAQAIISKKIEGNSFSIKTDKPNVEVSWMVTGIRHDPVAEKYRIVPEVEKNEFEKGKYLMPEVYGQPFEKSMKLPQHLEKGNGNNEVFKKEDINK